ncbi:hypothetical protein [Pseudomonas oryzihabitans]|uniref:hypothetical protein n=1 Tax=Pseudomonas oryzihabitans TaxID=47885 RepID=UPI001DEBC2F6|nr:hypothetical protein [Pseudomonas oryzihabitans]HJE69828.1 hypothetical protein [Pseudomonas oryzihabitans]
MSEPAKNDPKPSSFHTHSDGRGVRRVFCNGYEVKWALWADTQRGLVCYAPQPVKLKRNSDEIYTRMLRGQVTVEFV